MKCEHRKIGSVNMALTIYVGSVNRISERFFLNVSIGMVFFLARPAEWQRSFSNVDLLIVVVCCQLFT